MRVLKVLTIAAFVLVTILILHSGSQQRAPKYNTSSEVRVEGLIEEVQNYWCPISGEEGTHLMLKTDIDVLDIHVAPCRYLRGNGIEFRRGDHIAVIGSMVLFQAHDAMIAREVARGAETFTLRRTDGRPMWLEPYVPLLR